MPEQRYNAQYLADMLEALDSASMEEAIWYYERADSGPMGDDWLLAELGKEDLFFLLLKVLHRTDIAHPWLYERCREIEHAPDEHLDIWAREHYKSTIITFALTIQDILRDPEDTFGIFSHNRPGAKAFMRQIKQEFEGNGDLKALYPTVLYQNPKKDSPKWSEDEGIVVRRATNPKEATVEAWGLVDGMPTGKHFRKLIYDDVVTEASVTTPEMMDKTTKALELSYSLGAEGGVRRFIGTRYHFNDTYRTVLERGTATARLYNGTEENSGDIKRPVLWTPEVMAKKRRDMGIYTFGSQILQNPTADATHGFQRDWLLYWDADDGKGLNIYILADPANSKRKKSDYTAMWVVGLGPDEHFYWLAAYRDRMNLTERTNLLFDLHQKWKPIEVRYEEYGIQADREHIEAEMVRRKYRFEIIPVGGKVSKEDRIKRLIPLYEGKKMLLPRSFHITTKDGETKDMIHEFVENEYMAFPVPVHDDMLDSQARITDKVAVGGKQLHLKWPKQAPRIVVPVRRIKNKRIGY